MVAVTENESDICIHMHFLHFLATFDEIGQHTCTFASKRVWKISLKGE
jgi:hypothetical protein